MSQHAFEFGAPEALTSEDGWHKEPKQVQAPNGYELAARMILGKDDRWEIYAWDVVGPDVVRVTGGVPVLNARTGRRSWRGRGDTTTVSDAKRDEALRDWEVRTGSCSGCGGDGREYRGWSKARGFNYRTCTRCGGSGTPAASGAR